MKIKTWRDPYDSGFSPTRPKEIEINNGITVLVGCNGAGKTTLLLNIKEELERNGIPVHLFNNLNDGGSDVLGKVISGYQEFDCDDMSLGVSLLNASEGEAIKINLKRQSTLYDDFFKTGYFNTKKQKLKVIFSNKELENIEDKRRFLLFDATDSGMSIDSVCELKIMFESLLEEAKKQDIELYIVITANEYELCRDANCFDVNEGKYISFKDYEDYRNFILKSRIKKEKRIDKQIKWLENRNKKNVEKLNKLKASNNEKINKIKSKAEEEGRELTYSEKIKISDLERDIKTFIREHGLSLDDLEENNG